MNSVKIVALPGLPEKGDLFDFIESRDALEAETIRSEIESLAAAQNTTAVDRPSAKATASQSASRSDTVLILPSNTDVTITESATQIFTAIAPSHQLFIRAGTVMRLVEDDTGALRLDVERPAAFCSDIEKYGDIRVWRSNNEGEPVLKRAICPTETAEKLLSCEQTCLLPRIRALLACPVIADVNGQPTLLTRGYHDVNGGILITGGETPPALTLDEACEALRTLVADFDFATPGDRSRALASFLNHALRVGGWITGHFPIDVAEADHSQSGKTYRQKLIFELYREQPARIAKKDGGVGGMDESVSHALVGGRPFIQIDNLRGKLDSQFIEMFVTAGGVVGARVPHRGEISVDARLYSLFLSSNGVETTRDLANRSNIIRIRKRTACAFRKFAEGDLLSHVAARQPHYLGAVFAVIRAWAAAGRPVTADLRHHFREWSQALDWIVQELLGEAPLLEGHEGAQERVSNPALTWLRLVALAVKAEGRLETDLFASSISELCSDHEIDIPGLRDESDAARAKRIGVLLGRAFGKITHVVSVDGFIAERKESEKYFPEDKRYRPMKSYVFRQAVASSSTSSASPAPSA